MSDLVPSQAIVRLLWSGGIWLVLAASWVTACVWVARDSRQVFGTSMPWSLIFVTAGAAIELFTFCFGFSGLWILAATLAIGFASYLRQRDARVPPPERIVTAHSAANMLISAAAALGMEAAFRKWLAPIAIFAEDAAAEETVSFLKKDGNPTDEHDDETSRSLRDAGKLFAKAIRKRATDIHIEPKAEGETQVRCRIDGIMHKEATLSGRSGLAVISALKVVADMNIAERRRPQDGTFRVVIKGHPFEVRVATTPTTYGEKMALRLLDAEGGMIQNGLDGIGLSPAVKQSLRRIIHQPHGMLLICGPTGSGKTTTTYAALSEIDALSRNIVTIEDPIEYRLPNISQTGVNAAANLTFATILRSLLRQDPDVILVGEIRDRETAEIAMQAALTGHFVFSTVHANDAAATLSRMLDLGIDATLIQAALSAVLAQRLIRLLCDRCKEPYDAPPEFLRLLDAPVSQRLTLYRPRGCDTCGGKGYRGRTALSELLVLDDRIRDLLVARPSYDALLAAGRQGGMQTLRETALEFVCRGLTSIEAIDRVTK